ncbi:hypothetical protein GCM10010293_61800 [Streptomyces griseoflavus]|nr:hypothetical protein GCM10010293_61800 [Streptomyces griseoflavus]
MTDGSYAGLICGPLDDPGWTQDEVDTGVELPRRLEVRRRCSGAGACGQLMLRRKSQLSRCFQEFKQCDRCGAITELSDRDGGWMTLFRPKEVTGGLREM